jgi:hypothetical protein
VRARPARYRLTLRHPDAREEAGAFRRHRTDAPTLGHQLTTLERGTPVSWAVAEQHLVHDEAGEPFLELIAERDYAESESLPDHQLEHALERDDDGDAAATLARAEAAGFVAELVSLEPGEAPDWDEAARYLEALILEEINDHLLEIAGVDTRNAQQETWLDTVKQRLRDDLAAFRNDIEGDHDEIEEWDFRGGRVFSAIGRLDDEANPLSGYGWLSRLVDASVVGARALPARQPGRPGAVSFERDIRPLVRDGDIDAMLWAFDLASYDDVRANAEEIYERLAHGSMP